MICFVTNEILPRRRGGIGFYLEEAVGMLEEQGRECCLLLTDQAADAAEVEEHLGSLGRSAGAFTLTDLVPEPHVPDAAYPSEEMRTSHRVAEALEQLCERQQVRFVEFLDILGIGFATIQRKRTLGAFGEQTLAVRVHGTAELIRRAESRCYGLRRDLVSYFMERCAVRHADLLIASTPSVLEEYETLYDREGPGEVCPLPVRRLTEEPLPFRPPQGPPCSVLFAGTLQGQKGPDLFVEAAVRLCEEGVEGVRFVLMGRDFPTSAQYGSTVEELRSMVPQEYADRFDFRTEYYGGPDLLRAARECSFAVQPSRWEAFCLVAHELRWVGTPLALSPIGPFRDCFEEGRDAIFTDGTANGLADVMRALLTGEKQMTGREDVESLYLTAEQFAAAYEREPEPCPAPEAGSGTVTVVVGPGAEEGIRASADSALASSWEHVQVLVPEPGGIKHESVQTVGRNRGTVATFLNQCLEEAKGELICCLPAGYRISPSYLEQAVSALARCPDAAAVSCIRATDGGRPAAVPYGLDPVLITVEDGAGLSGAVMRSSVFREKGLSYREEMFALHHWELAWSMAEQGLRCEVLPEVHLRAAEAGEPRLAREPTLNRRQRYHLLQTMAGLHRRLVQQHPEDVLKAHTDIRRSGGGPELTDRWLLDNVRALRLLRLGLRRCLREGPKGLLSHVVAKARRTLGGKS